MFPEAIKLVLSKGLSTQQIYIIFLYLYINLYSQ